MSEPGWASDSAESPTEAEGIRTLIDPHHHPEGGHGDAPVPAHSDAEPAEPEPASGPDPQPNAESAPQAEPRNRPGRGHCPRPQDQVGGASASS